jgi:glycolate oxidase iron-sulfur subunit
MISDVTAVRVLRCRSGALEWAVAEAALREVAPWSPVTRIPGAPDSVLGLANLQGELVVVLDSRRLLGQPAPEPPGAMILVDAGGRRVALHLPCTQRAVIRSAPALRALLARVPGLDLVEAPDTGCCGAAGLHAIEHPARADALAAPLLDWLAHCGATELLSANIGCRLHLARAAGLPVRHPLELLAEHLA